MGAIRRGRRREVLNTTEQGARGGKGVPDHSFTFLLHFYFRHWKRKQKSAKGRERLSRVNWQVQREELVGGYDHEMNCCGAMGRRVRKEKKGCLLVKRPLILGYKNRQVTAGDKLCAPFFQHIKLLFPTSSSTAKAE